MRSAGERMALALERRPRAAACLGRRRWRSRRRSLGAPTDLQFSQPFQKRAACFANPPCERVALIGSKLVELLYHLMTGLEEREKFAAFVQSFFPPTSEAPTRP